MTDQLDPSRPNAPVSSLSAQDRAAREAAARFWHSSRPLPGSPAETYLRRWR